MSTKSIQKKTLLADKENTEYEELSETIRSMLAKHAISYIPELCEKLKKKYKDENELSKEEIRQRNKEIEQRIVADWGNNNPLLTNTVYVSMPDWIKNPNKVKGAKDAINRKIQQKQHQALERIYRAMPEPPREKPEEFEGEEIGGLAGHYGDSADTMLTLYANINLPAKQLFRALTQKDHPYEIDDLIVDFLKPSREFRKTIFYEVETSMRVSLYNILRDLRDAIDDTLPLIEQANRK